MSKPEIEDEEYDSDNVNPLAQRLAFDSSHLTRIPPWHGVSDKFLIRLALSVKYALTYQSHQGTMVLSHPPTNLNIYLWPGFFQEPNPPSQSPSESKSFFYILFTDTQLTMIKPFSLGKRSLLDAKSRKSKPERSQRFQHRA